VRFDLSFDGTVAPVGLSGIMQQMAVTEDAMVERVVDRVTSDTDIGASESFRILKESNIDVYRIERLMSAGLLGRKRRFVPTRWAITAVDDTLSTQMKKQIARYTTLQEIRVFHAEVFGNRIVCILVPGDWKFEMIEIWGKQSLWGGETDMIVEDREGEKKRNYSPITGAYYSARLAITEYLTAIQRSARAVVIRSISSEYWAPLGTWVIREATRKAMAGAQVPYETIDQAVAAASAILGFSHWLQHSTLIPELKTQRTLFQF
jgi:hypothetical protein